MGKPQIQTLVKHSFSPEEELHTDQEYTVFLPLQLKYCIVVSEHSSNLGELSALKQIFQIQSKTQMHNTKEYCLLYGSPMQSYNPFSNFPYGDVQHHT